MSQPSGPAGPQFRADRPREQEAVRTTIVGGRPPGSGQPVGDIPRGIEVLVKKAAVDAEFKELLLARRAAAAVEIGLTLAPAEAMMLAVAPAEQLEAIIARTSVPSEHRRAFLGQAAGVMLAALGIVTTTGCEPTPPPTTGIQPDRPPPPKGIQPDRLLPAPGGHAVDRPPTAADVQPARPVSRGVQPDLPEGGIRPTRFEKKPAEKPTSVEQRVVAAIAKQLHLDGSDMGPKEWLVVDLDASAAGRAEQKKALEREFQIEIPAEDFKKLRTVGDAVACVQKALDQRNRDLLKQALPVPPDMNHPMQNSAGGIRPDKP